MKARKTGTNSSGLGLVIVKEIVEYHNGHIFVLSKLPPKELQILALLAQNPNTVISSEQLFRDLWGMESFGDY